MAQTEVRAPANENFGVVASSAYVDGRRVAEVRLAEAGEWARRPHHVVWIGLHEPGAELLDQLQAQFGLHALAIEDAGKAHQRPKLEQYEAGLFIVARTAQLVNGRIAFGETHLFVGKGYVVSVRHGASVSYAAVRRRCEACPTTLSHGADSSSTPCSTSSSTTTSRFWRPSMLRWRPSRTGCSARSSSKRRSSVSTCSAAIFCGCATLSSRLWRSAASWSTRR